MNPILPSSAYIKVLIGLVLSCTLFACSSNQHTAPVSEIGAGSLNSPVYSNNSSQTYRVRSGETLYSIAFEHNLDYSLLAQANEISSPYVIFPGQILNLDTTSLPRPSNGSGSASNSSSIRSNNTVNNTSTTRAIGAGSSNAVMRWSWPANGNVIASFSTSGTENKGIDIAGQKGDDVLAAEDGEVVYAGSGLLRYGDLLIIKHNNQFLSAYAHNSELMVAEGDRVSRGQKIASLGSTGIDREMLHFEIRLNGNPVDPAQYLPPR